MAEVCFASLRQCFPGCLTALRQALQQAEAANVSPVLTITGWHLGRRIQCREVILLQRAAGPGVNSACQACSFSFANSTPWTRAGLCLLKRCLICCCFVSSLQGWCRPIPVPLTSGSSLLSALSITWLCAADLLLGVGVLQ